MKSALVVVASLSLLACDPDKDSDQHKTSCNTQTSLMKASLSAQSDATTTQFYAALFTDGAGSLTLDCGDQLTVAAADGPKVTLTREPESASGVIHYIGSGSATAASSSYVFSFDRPPPVSSAPASHSHVPPVFTAAPLATSVKPAQNEPIKLKLDPPMVLEESVTPTTVRLRLVISGSCLVTQTYLWTPKVLFPPEVDKDGTVILQTKLFNRQGTEAECDATLDVAELTIGDLDPAFGGSLTREIPAEGSRHVPPVKVHVAW